MAKVRVTLPQKRFIPTLGKGPFKEPVLISEELYRSLVRLGYVVNVHQAESLEKEVMYKREIVRANGDRVIVLQTPTPEELEENKILNQKGEELQEPKEEPLTIIESKEEEIEEVPEEEEEVKVEDEKSEVEINKEKFTEEEIKRLGSSKTTKVEIQELFDEKEIAYDEEEDTIKELLAKVGLTR